MAVMPPETTPPPGADAGAATTDAGPAADAGTTQDAGAEDAKVHDARHHPEPPPIEVRPNPPDMAAPDLEHK